MGKEKKKKLYSVILHEGTALFNQRGYHGVSIQTIANASRISVGSFYNCFLSKDDCYMHVVEQVEQIVKRAMVSTFVRLFSPINKLTVLVQLLCTYTHDYPLLRGSLLMDSYYVSPRLAERYENKETLRQYVRSQLRAVLQEGQGQGRFRTTDFLDLPEYVMFLLGNLLMQSTKSKFTAYCDNTIIMLQRSLVRTARLRHRAERLDRRQGQFIGSEED